MLRALALMWKALPFLATCSGPAATTRSAGGNFHSAAHRKHFCFVIYSPFSSLHLAQQIHI